MVATTYSPHRDAGGALQLHSPTHPHHMDAHMEALAELRRGLSRSPSKHSDLRSFASRSNSPSSRNLPYSPSPLSPRRVASENILHVTASPVPSPLAIPFPPSAKIQRPPTRRTAQSQPGIRTRTSPKSPSASRVLLDSASRCNVPPTPMTTRRSFEKDKKSPESTTPCDKENDVHLDTEGFPKPNLKRRSGNFESMMAAASPLKRSDGIMSLDQAGQESPSAKRRSLHGASLGSDFNIFDLESKSDDESPIENHGSVDDIDLGFLSPSTFTDRFTSIPRRSSSLRKSTLQQRHFERPALFKTRQTSEVQNPASLVLTANSSSRPKQRMSLENHIPSPARDSPFSPGNLPNASIHMVNSQLGNPHSRHPLSRTITQSSSGSSMAEDSPTHEPIHRMDRPRTMIDFSRSLPIGSARPTGASHASTEVSSQGSFATPASYKFAKPLPQAFMSTGLISKKNRNVDEPHGGLPKSHMPDTPCKRASLHLLDAPPGTVEQEPRPKDFRHSFGTPSTPHIFGPKPSQLSYPAAGSLFANHTRQSLARKASFVSIDGDDSGRSSQSPTARPASQSTTESEFPPTPTKRTFGSSVGSSYQSRQIRDNADSKPLMSSRFSSSKLDSINSSPTSTGEDSDSVMEESPSACLSLKSSLKYNSTPASFTKSRLLRSLNSPTPLRAKAAVPFLTVSVSNAHAKLLCLSPASPRQSKTVTASPHTPQESLVPPDPSGLSISGNNDHPLFYQHNNSSSVVLPATPTAPREYFASFGQRASFPLTGVDSVDVDASLTSRFEKVELVGTGEFSQVYRVTEQPEQSPFHPVFSLSSARSTSQASLPEKVWAVKKSRAPYSGQKDRQRKIHEVDVLKGLGQSDHIISYVDSWEDKNHLYIQTEFCEEGALDLFLARVGLKARLDDFRIWKILLELSLVRNSCNSLVANH